MSSDELYQKMAEVLQHAPENRHSYFQMKYFIIGKEPTTQAQMWQCLRELQTRKATIDSLMLSIDESKDQLDLTVIEAVKTKYCQEYPTEIIEREQIIRDRQLERKKRQLQLSLVQLEENLRFAWQEAQFFLQMFEAIEKIEPLKDYDDLDAQKEYWNELIAQQINLKLLLRQPLDIELAQTALSLHEDAPIRLQVQKVIEHVREQIGSIKE